MKNSIYEKMIWYALSTTIFRFIEQYWKDIDIKSIKRLSKDNYKTMISRTPDIGSFRKKSLAPSATPPSRASRPRLPSAVACHTCSPITLWILYQAAGHLLETYGATWARGDGGPAPPEPPLGYDRDGDPGGDRCGRPLARRWPRGLRADAVRGQGPQDPGRLAGGAGAEEGRRAPREARHRPHGPIPARRAGWCVNLVDRSRII